MIDRSWRRSRHYCRTRRPLCLDLSTEAQWGHEHQARHQRRTSDDQQLSTFAPALGAS
jgi:hypothetical protein